MSVSGSSDTSACTAKTCDADYMENAMEFVRRRDLKVVRRPVQMIEHRGDFRESAVEEFVNSATNLLAPGESYAIISIIGPQGSGKSFLLNKLFGTNFPVTDVRKARSQTTKGIMIAQSSKPCALIMDVEGSDGRERGENGVSFERQSALFALTVSDLMMINMWLHDIGREQSGSIPLLRTVFQERVKLDRGRTKVMVIIRAYDYETPFEILENEIQTKLEELWMSVHYRPGEMAVQFSDYIEVMVVALPEKVLKREFEEEVTKLRGWFAKENIAGLRQDKNSTSGFSFSAKNIWEVIKENKQLDLSGHKVAVSMYVCEKVANECLAVVIRDKDFEGLNDAMSSDEFIVKLESLLQYYVTRYDKDTEMSDETQRDAKRDVLKQKILQSAEPFAKNLLYKIRSEFVSEKWGKITDLLKKADATTMEAQVSTIVEDFLELFTRSCGGLKSKYESLCLESCNMLNNELGYHAKATILNIKEQRLKEEVKRAKANTENTNTENAMGFFCGWDLKEVRRPVQMIEYGGDFCEYTVEKFVKSATSTPGKSCAIISIIGPYSSGKSFLLNQLFGTNFGVMDSRSPRVQPAQGLLLARSTEPFALIIDIQGSRRKIDEDDIFGRQTTLFALTVSDIMMINLWLPDMQQGESITLLRIVFQERVKLDPGKIKMLVVLRGYNYETPFKTLEEDILKTMKQIWMSVHDRPDETAVQFSDYIEVIVVALPDLDLEKKFEEEITKLREWFAEENIMGLHQDKTSISGFSVRAKNIWDSIRQNKSPDLHGNKVAISMYVCEKVANECLAAVIRDKDFERLNDVVSSHEFVVKLESLLQHSVTRYNKDIQMSDETQRDAKLDILKEKILQSAEPFAKKLLYKICSKFFSEKKDKVTALLNTEDDPAMEAPTIVEDFLELFLRSCGGLRSKYKLLCLESRDMLRTELEFLAKATILHIKEQRMKEEVRRAKAEAERVKHEAKHEREEAEAMLERKLQEFEAKQEAARQGAVRTSKDIEEKAKAAAAHSRSERSSYKSRLFNFALSA